MLLPISFYKNMLFGTFHSHYTQVLEWMPVRNMILNHHLEFDRNTESADLVYYISAENYSQFFTLSDEEQESYIAVTVFQGLMTQQNQYCGGYGTSTLLQKMLWADNDARIIGHIMYIDSGGGQSISLDPFRESFSELKKPVVAFVRNMAASAAYGIASFASEIYASKPDAIVGSIGTMIAFDGMPANSISPDGTQHIRLYASQSTKKNLAFEEALNGNYKTLIEDVLNPTNEDFLALIQKNRKSILAESQLDGSDYRASEVVGSLVDGIQSFEQTILRVKELSSKKTTNKSTKTTKSTKSENKMGKSFLFLAAFFALATLESDADGDVTLNSEQADKLNNFFRDSLNNQKGENTGELTALKAENARLKAENQALNAEITELQKQPGATTSTAVVEGDSHTTQGTLPQEVWANGSFDQLRKAFNI